MLEFNRRVLAQAADEAVPLLERLGFLTIVSSNLDEFFEIRVAGLKEQIKLEIPEPGPDGRGPQEVLAEVAVQAHALVAEQYRLLNEVLLPQLAAAGINFPRRTDWTPAQRQWIRDYFFREVLPVLTPIGLDPAVKLLADRSVEGVRGFLCGGNETDTHYLDVCFGRDLPQPPTFDFGLVMAGDRMADGEGAIEIVRGIEVGHIFQLGTKYSEAMHATVLDDQGQERTLVMGCYGIGIGRTAAAAIEQNHDENGIIWPMPLAPFQVIVTMLNPNDADVLGAGETLYQQLLDAGIEVLLDDRDERPGSKFKDADLLGIPLRVNVGARGLKEESFELQERRSGERTMLPIEGAAARIVELVRAAL